MPFYVNQSSQFYKIFVASSQISLMRYINGRNNFCTKTNSISFNTKFLLYVVLVFIFLTLKTFASGNFLLIWFTDLSNMNEMKYSKFWLYERRVPLLHLSLYDMSYHSLFLMFSCFLLIFVCKKHWISIFGKKQQLSRSTIYFG